jgi:hypothetical protein
MGVGGLSISSGHWRSVFIYVCRPSQLGRVECPLPLLVKFSRAHATDNKYSTHVYGPKSRCLHSAQPAPDIAINDLRFRDSTVRHCCCSFLVQYHGLAQEGAHFYLHRSTIRSALRLHVGCIALTVHYGVSLYMGLTTSPGSPQTQS